MKTIIKYIQKKSTKSWTIEKECKKLGIKQEDVVYCGNGTKWENIINMDFYKYSSKKTKKRKINHYMLEINISSKEMIVELRGKILMGDDSLEKFNDGLSHCAILWNYVNEFTKNQKANDFNGSKNAN